MSVMSHAGAELRLDLDLSGLPTGAELLTVDVVAGAVADAADNLALPAAAFAPLADLTPPSFTLTVQFDNKVVLDWSEEVVPATSTTGPLSSKFTTYIFGGTATLSGSVSVSTAPRRWVVNLPLLSTPTGGEVLEIILAPAPPPTSAPPRTQTRSGRHPPARREGLHVRARPPRRQPRSLSHSPNRSPRVALV